MSRLPTIKELRARLVAEQLVARGISDPAVLEAMGTVPREKFVPVDRRHLAYADRPLSIGAGQTVSQPYIVAYMIEALQLKGGEKVLEIGAGSGYAAAVLAEIAAHVFTIERIGELAQLAKDNLADAGVNRVTVRHADGTDGWPEEAPFDAILVSAGAPKVPDTLRHQLKTGGRMVVPVGEDPTDQELIRITRTGEEAFDRTHLTYVRFVPLIGHEGWKPDVT
jgi:protein-L-isoaspartate(D-aspartate) O-methyltransferase